MDGWRGARRNCCHATSPFRRDIDVRLIGAHQRLKRLIALRTDIGAEPQMNNTEYREGILKVKFA